MNHDTMKCLLLFTFLVLSVNGQDDDDYYDYDESIKCNTCYSEEYITKFGVSECSEDTDVADDDPDPLLSKPNVKQCCSSGEFGFKCQVHANEGGHCEFNKWYCGSAGEPSVNKPKLMDFSCPEHCTSLLSDKYSTTDLDENGNLTLKSKHQNAKVEDLCVASECPNSNDFTVMPVCLCPKDLKDESQKYPEKIRRCCPDSITVYDTVQSFKKFTCVSEHNRTEGPECSTDHYKVETYTEEFEYNPEDCLALVLPENSNEDLLRPKVLHCKSPCDGKHPCLRLCNDKDDNEKAKILNDSLFSDLSLNISTEMTKAPQTERNSRSSKLLGTELETLDPSKCIGRFKLEKDSESKINLIRLSNDKKYGPKEFCLTFNETDGTIGAEILKEDIKKDIGFYDMHLWISAVMVLLILFIHYAYKNQLVKKPGLEPDRPTIMLLFFTASVFLVYVFKCCNQIRHINYDHPKVCTFLGFAQQFSILSMFSFLTSYGAEVLMLIYGWRPSAYRLKVLMGKSVILPLGFCLMTGLTEAFAQECISLKPSFGEGYRCFFASEMAEVFWYLIPIGIYLLINAVIFILACHKVWIDDTQELNNPLETELRDGNMQNYVTYVKLLTGFSILWILQIVAGIYPTQSKWEMKCVCDILLGWHVFICLVCTRKVSRVICSKRKWVVNEETGEETVEIVPLRQHIKEKIADRRTQYHSQTTVTDNEKTLQSM